MSKILRLNDETIKLLEESKKILKEEWEEKYYIPLQINNDNLIIQTALRTFIEFDTFIPKKSK